MKLLWKRNIGAILQDMGLGKEFLDLTWSIKGKICTLYFIEMTTVCSRGWRTSDRLGGNICKPHVWKRANIWNTYNTLKTQQWKSLIRKWAKKHEQTFYYDVEMADKHIKICPPSLASRVIQIKFTRRYYCVPIRMGKIKNSNNTKCWLGWGERGSHIPGVDEK